VGRFINRDSWRGDDNAPITLNQFVYANANPVLYRDPSGRWCIAGFSWGPGQPCTQKQIDEWVRNYQAAAQVFHTLGGPTSQNTALFAVGVLDEFLDAIAVVPVMSLTRCILTEAYDEYSNRVDQTRRDPYFVAGRYFGRGTAAAVGAAEVGLALAGVGGGTTISLSGIGAAIGIPAIAGSVALGGHGALVLGHVAVKQALDPLPNIYFAEGHGNVGSPVRIPKRATVADVVGNPTYKGLPVRAGQKSVTGKKVEQYANLLKDDPSSFWSNMKDKITIIRDSEGYVLLNGHHRFVASRLLGIEIPESAIEFARDFRPYTWTTGGPWKIITWDGLKFWPGG
jgi:hypothetical protein